MLARSERPGPHEKCWFGAYPPKPHVGTPKRVSRMKINWIALIALGVFGILLILCTHVSAMRPPIFENEAIKEINTHIGGALLVAAVLGWLVDLQIKKAIAKDAVEAALGYLLPSELRGELSWIYNQPFICKSHIHTVWIARIESTQLVTVRTEVIREFENITSDKKEFDLGLAIDEWFYEEAPSKITYLAYILEGKQKETLSVDELIRNSGGVLSVESKQITVRGGAKLTTIFQSEETMPESCSNFCHFTYPTSHVTVTVNAPPDIGAQVHFSRRESGPKVTQKTVNTWQLDGVLLPLQAIRLHWYPKDKEKRWLDSGNG